MTWTHFGGKPRYRKEDGWVLCSCRRCGHMNYVEPHGATAFCVSCRARQEHVNFRCRLCSSRLTTVMSAVWYDPA